MAVEYMVGIAPHGPGKVGISKVGSEEAPDASKSNGYLVRAGQCR